MSDHSESPYPQTDITDVFAFQKPGDPAKSILILNVNPDAPKQAATFDPEASYELKIDTDGDAEAEIAFHVQFASAGDGRQVATLYRATGVTARDTGPVGEVLIQDAPVSFDGVAQVTTASAYHFYAGLRSDPWFADVSGFFNNFQFTGQDTFANKNVFSIVLEVPNDALGTDGRIGIWARTVAPEHGAPTVVDQAGHPLINALFNPAAEDQHTFNRTPPAQQREHYVSRFTATLQGFGYSEEGSAALAAELLPDILHYDPAIAAEYPNGRQLTDDILDLRLALITRGRVTTDLTGPHTDLLPTFPYLGPPHSA